MQEATLFERYAVPLIVIERHDVQIGSHLVEDAWDEIAARSPQVEGFASGYLLGAEDRSRFPSASALLSELEARVLRRCSEEEFSFSFLKGHRGILPSASEGMYFEGPHLDSHPALSNTVELLRVLINLSEHPKKFRYYKTESFELKRRGVLVSKQEFSQLDIPTDVPSQIVEIPAREEGEVYSLRFWASVVPHVGVNEPEGSLLASFESPRPFPDALFV